MDKCLVNKEIQVRKLSIVLAAMLVLGSATDLTAAPIDSPQGAVLAASQALDAGLISHEVTKGDTPWPELRSVLDLDVQAGGSRDGEGAFATASQNVVNEVRSADLHHQRQSDATTVVPDNHLLTSSETGPDTNADEGLRPSEVPLLLQGGPIGNQSGDRGEKPFDVVHLATFDKREGGSTFQSAIKVVLSLTTMTVLFLMIAGLLSLISDNDVTLSTRAASLLGFVILIVAMLLHVSWQPHTQEATINSLSATLLLALTGGGLLILASYSVQTWAGESACLLGAMISLGTMLAIVTTQPHAQEATGTPCGISAVASTNLSVRPTEDTGDRISLGVKG